MSDHRSIFRDDPPAGWLFADAAAELAGLDLDAFLVEAERPGHLRAARIGKTPQRFIFLEDAVVAWTASRAAAEGLPVDWLLDTAAASLASAAGVLTHDGKQTLYAESTALSLLAIARMMAAKDGAS